MDAAGFSGISSRRKETKRKVFAKEEVDVKLGEGEVGSSVEVVKSQRKKRIYDEVESPLKDKKAYDDMRKEIPTRVKDKARIEADVWLERKFSVRTYMRDDC